MSNINDWWRGVDGDGGYLIDPETGKRYRWVEVSPQDTPAIEDTIKNLDNRIKELEKKRSNSIMDIRLK